VAHYRQALDLKAVLAVKQANTTIPIKIKPLGFHRNDVFFCDNDKNYYLDLLQEYTIKHKVAVLAYCLMNNHIHLILY
jgi:putative transposase